MFFFIDIFFICFNFNIIFFIYRNFNNILILYPNMITKISTNILIGIFSFLLFSCSNQSIKSIDQDLDGIIGQLEYDHIRLQSPDGKIPSNIRKRELAFAAKLNTVSASSRAIGDYTWKHRGPINIGGRTRALAQDITNPDVLIAGGASGGLWRSIDKGASWTHVIDLTEQYGISCLVQDTRSGKEHIWYYVASRERK